MQITSIIGDWTYSKPLADIAEEFKKTFKGQVAMTNHFCIRHQIFSPKLIKKMETDVKKSDIVLVCMVFDEAVIKILQQYSSPKRTYIVLASEVQGMKLARFGKFCLGDVVDSIADSKVTKVFRILKGMTGKSSPMEVRKMIGMADSILKVLRFGKWKDAHNYIQAWKYYFNGGRENIRNMLMLVMAQYHGIKTAYDPPNEVPETFIVHPRTQQRFTSVKDYLNWYDLSHWMPTNGFTQKKKPLVGILFYKQRYQSEDTRDLTMVVEKLEAKGIGVIPAISLGAENMKSIKTFFLNDHGPCVEAIISFLFFRLEGGPMGGDYEGFEKLCQQMNVPLINYVSMAFTTIEEWRERDEGIAPLEMTLNTIMPELDGLIEGSVIAGGVETSPADKNMVRYTEPIEERIQHAVDRTYRWISLKYMPNKDKKIAFVLFNYPPGKDTIGNAGNFDTLESLIRLFDRMREEGYNVSGYPKNRHEFVRLITKKSILNQSNWSALTKIKENAFKVPVQTYHQWFDLLPQVCRDEMAATWGDVPGDVMADEENIYIPGLQFGNIFVGFQPAKGIHGDPSKTYHDTALPPHHQYYAFYKFLQEDYQADALVHFGTHGTLEFLPGKQVALSESCFPDIFVGTLPHLYVYTCSNPSEAMIAKRRSYGLLVDHMTPPMIVSDLYGKFSEMETDIHNYYHFKEQSPARAEKLKQKIVEDAKENNLIDIESEDADISSLYNSLNEMKGSLMTKGLHVMGRSLQGDDLVEYVLGIVRFERGELSSLHQCLALGHGLDWDEARKNPSKITKSGKIMGVVCDEINAQARELIETLLVGKSTIKNVLKQLKLKLDKEVQKSLTQTLTFAIEIGEKLANNREIDNMIRALKFEFISPGLGGHPIRSPNVVPTGRNPYQFNPNQIPTPLACQRGEEIARQIIVCYQEDHDNCLPETVAVVLWGFETMKTQGETVGEIFHLMGIRPKRSGVGDMVGLEPISLQDLGRPRLDVAVEICGMFRDTFPVLLRYLDRAFRMVSALDEPHDMNFVRKHTLAIAQALEKEGISREQAEELSPARIFGPSAANYGTDVTNLIETSEWEEQSQIADLHLAKMSHVYGDIHHAESSIQTFKEVLATVDVVAQVRDNEEYGVADLDHYYEFLGGLSTSVESVRKSRPLKQRHMKPQVLVADSTRDKIKTMDIKRTIDYEVRTKLLNPTWMKGQMESGYKGVKNLSDRMENLLGWQASSSGSVGNWVWSEMADKYVFDEAIRKQMMKENIWAVEDQLQRLMEVYQRGMWDASDEEIEKLKQIYLELEAEIEEREE